MYAGRFIVVAPGIGAYRVSSRSFPNRQITDRGGTLTVEPTADAPPTDNPYIAYNCLRVLEDQAVIGNGSHVDPIAEKLELGYPARDALAEALLALDYEKDDYNTPRIAGIVGGGSESGNGSRDEFNADTYVGIVRRDALLVRAVHEPTIVATYERDRPGTFEFDATTAEEAAIALYNHEYEHPVCAAGITVEHEETTSIETAIVNEQ